MILFKVSQHLRDIALCEVHSEIAGLFALCWMCALSRKCTHTLNTHTLNTNTQIIEPLLVLLHQGFAHSCSVVKLQLSVPTLWLEKRACRYQYWY